MFVVCLLLPSRGLLAAAWLVVATGCERAAALDPATAAAVDDEVRPPAVVAAAPTTALPPAPPPPPSTRGPIRAIDPAANSGLVAFVDALPADGSAFVGPLAGNGGRDVLIFVPPGIDSSADFRLVYHFHGTHSERVAMRRKGMAKKEWVGWNRVQQTIDAVGELQARGPDNIVLVYPLSAGKRREPGLTGWYNKEYDRMWMASAPPAKTDDFETLHAEVVALLAKDFSIPAARLHDEVLAEGHSAGGIALLNIARSGTHRVGEYLFLDASFQGWADGCWEALRASGDDALVSLVVTRNGIADPFGKPDPWCTRLEEGASAWELERRMCGGSRAKTKSCADLEQAALDWDHYRAWCGAMRDGGMPGVFVHVTRISHGEQPRHFGGGLELPRDRATRQGATTPRK